MNDIEILEDMIKDAKEFEKQFNTAEIEQGTVGQKRIQAIENLIQRVKELEEEKEENKKKDKIIDKMAENIYGNDGVFYLLEEVNSIEAVKEYFTNLVEKENNRL